MNELIKQHEQELHKAAYELHMMQTRGEEIEKRMTELGGVIAALRHAQAMQAQKSETPAATPEPTPASSDPAA